jgi:transcriptional regulator with XRE-family HTH domain
MKKDILIEKMNFTLIVQEILVLLRGRLSQSQMSQKLGYNYNKINKWERGLHKITWEEFIQYTTKKSINLTTYFSVNHLYNHSLIESSLLVFHLTKSTNFEQISKILGISKSKLYRIISGKTKPYFEDILKILFITSFDFVSFLKLLTKEQKVPSLYYLYENQDIHSQIMLKRPRLFILLRFFELPFYLTSKKHDNQIISKKLGTTEEIIQEDITYLLKHNLIKKQNEKYTVLAKIIRFQNANEAKSCYHYFLQYQIFLMNKRKKNKSVLYTENQRGRGGHLIGVFSNEDIEKIKDLMNHFFKEVSSISVKEKPSLNSKVFLVNMGFIDLLEN